MSSSSTSLLHQLCFTPMRDLARGHLTARLDVKARIAVADIPAPAKALVTRVVRRTRLWRLERAGVADELIAHFADGLESGATIEELIAAFGDERRSAKLIRRAKIRNRPLAWHVLHAIRWIMAALVIFYLGVAVCFFLGRPTPSVNYVEIANRRVEAISLEQRGWPLYWRVIEPVVKLPAEADEQWWQIIFASPRSKHWPLLASWVHQHAGEIDLLRQASQKPALGYLAPPSTQLWPGGTPLAGRMQIAELMLRADARVAREESDATRLRADMVALLNMSRQMRDQDLVRNMPMSVLPWPGLLEIQRTLASKPQLLSAEDLQELSHLLSRPRSAADLIGLSGERVAFNDLVQRLYTDNGAGSGRLTPRWLSFYWGGQTRLFGRIISPATLIFGADRRHVTNEFDRVMEQAETNLRRPLRETDWQPLQRQLRGVERPIGLSGALSELFWQISHPMKSFMPMSLDRVHREAERYLGGRDGTVVAMALELYRRQHGAYPQSLDALVPALLPAVPVDRITGGPLGYRLVEGRPIIYSLGADRDDDGGRPSRTDLRNDAKYPTAPWGVSPQEALDGDWVLYPPPAPDPVDD